MSSQAAATSQIATEMVSQPQQVDLNINTQGSIGVSHQSIMENVAMDERTRENAPRNGFNIILVSGYNLSIGVVHTLYHGADTKKKFHHHLCLYKIMLVINSKVCKIKLGLLLKDRSCNLPTCLLGLPQGFNMYGNQQVSPMHPMLSFASQPWSYLSPYGFTGYGVPPSYPLQWFLPQTLQASIPSIPHPQVYNMPQLVMSCPQSQAYPSNVTHVDLAKEKDFIDRESPKLVLTQQRVFLEFWPPRVASPKALPRPPMQKLNKTLPPFPNNDPFEAMPRKPVFDQNSCYSKFPPQQTAKRIQEWMESQEKVMDLPFVSDKEPLLEHVPTSGSKAKFLHEYPRSKPPQTPFFS